MSNIIVDPPNLGEIEGVKPAIAEKIYEILKSGRRYFGSSGASLTHQAFNPEYQDKGIDTTLAKIGLEGERDTTTFLRQWMKDKPNAVLVDSVHIRGWGKEEIDEETGIIDGGDTDHLLFLGTEVILIDSKRWKKKARYMVSEEGNVLRFNKHFPGGKISLPQATKLWLSYFEHSHPGGRSLKITPIVCVNAEEVTVFRNIHWFRAANYRLVEIDRLAEYLDDKYENIDEYDKTHINSTLVSQAVVNAVKPYDIYDRVFSREAINAFR